MNKQRMREKGAVAHEACSKVAAVALAAMALAGCRLPLQPIPGPGREGMLYCYTEDYGDRYLPFCLLGKSLVASKGNGSWEIIPPPTAIFPGLPLVLVEKYAICPAVDTLMIPYDMLMKLRNKYVCANDGVWIQLVDRAGHPIPETEIDLTIDANSGRRIVYRGEVMPRGYYETCVKTGADGKAYVPIKLSSCREARFKGFAITSNGVEQFDGTLERDHYWRRVGTGGSNFGRWDETAIPRDWYVRWRYASRCRNCRAYAEYPDILKKGGVWTPEGVCRHCGKALDPRVARNIEGVLRRRVARWPESRDEYMLLNALTGLPVARIEEICGKCPESEDVKLVTLYLNGEWSEQPNMPEEVVFAEGTDSTTYLRNRHQTIAATVLSELLTGEMPAKAEDFDSWWDGASAAMMADRRGEPSVEELAGLCSPSVKVSRVVFDIGGRSVAGILSEPVAHASRQTPILAFCGRGTDMRPDDIPKPSDRTVLYLSVFEPGYEYWRGEYDIKEKYHLSQHAQLEGYSIDGIDKGREAYFFYPVISGAVWASEWLSERDCSCGVRCVGTDQGAALAIMTAALGGKVAEVVVHRPEFTGVAEWPNAWPAFHWHNRSGLMDEARKWIPYYELTGFAGRVVCPVTLILNPAEMPDWRRADATVAVFKALRDGTAKRLVVDVSFSAGDAIRNLVFASGVTGEDEKEGT